MTISRLVSKLMIGRRLISSNLSQAGWRIFSFQFPANLHRQLRIVREDRIHTPMEEPAHILRLVHGPYMDAALQTVHALNLLGGDIAQIGMQCLIFPEVITERTRPGSGDTPQRQQSTRDIWKVTARLGEIGRKE